MPNKKYFKIIIISVAVIFVITTGIIFLKSKEAVSLNQKEYTMGNTPGNIINKGLTAYQNGYTYYSNISDDSKLYRMKEDGSEKKKICDDSCSYINIIDSWIYYRNDADLGKVYKIKTDGTMRTCLNKDNSKFVTAVGDYIYYCNSSEKDQITRIKNDGSDKRVICGDGADFMNVSNGWIYYSNTHENYSLYKISIDGKKRILLSKDMCHFINVSGDWIYYGNYSKECKLYKIKINGRNNTILDNTATENINVYNDWIYYKSANYECGDYGLYKVKTDGTGKENICNNFIEGINIAGSWIFFTNDYDSNMLYKVKPDGTMKQNNDGVTVVRNTYDLNNALLSNIPYEIKDDKIKKAYEKATEIVKKLIKPEMTDLEKELILHNYIVTHSKYDKYAKDSGNAYGILINGIGKCSGYAEAMQLLLSLSNIECQYVNGDNHAWNIVKIDGKYYHLDATWDDTPPDMGNHIILKYFNLPDNSIKSDHKWEKSNYKTCVSDRFSYFRDMVFAVYQDGWIYYSSISDGYRLYKIRIDGSGKEKLSNNIALYILIDGKYIYFSNYSDGGYLYRMDINGKGEKQLNNENCKTIDIENGILKYINDSGVTKTMKIR